MQFPPNSFGSDTAIKELYRQYSTTFKHHETEKNPIMTQSSNLPFNSLYNAFGSSTNIKNFTLDRFKHSEAKSIIEKLMQTKDLGSQNNLGSQNQFSSQNYVGSQNYLASQNQIRTKNHLEDLAFINDLKGIEVGHEAGPIPLGKTQQKIFNEVVNLISEIQEIREKTQLQNEEFLKIKIQLKQQGIQLPESEPIRPQSPSKTFKRYSSQQLETMLESNDRMQAEIDAIIKELTNLNQNQSQPETLIESYSKKNTILKKQLSALKLEVMNAGDVDERDIHEMNVKIEELKNKIFMLEQKRMGRMTEGDDQLRLLKQQNQTLRTRTIELLRRANQPYGQRKAEAIRFLKLQEDEKIKHYEMMNLLKEKYESLLAQNSRLKVESQENMYQVESKVSSFKQQNIGEYRSAWGKENYLQNYENERPKMNPYPQYEDSIFKSRKAEYYYN